MSTLLAYHGDAAVKRTFLRRVRAHAGVARHILLALAEGRLFTDSDAGLVFSSFFPTRPYSCVSVSGYIVGTLHIGNTRKQFKAHQAIWLAAGNDIADGLMLDHINRVKTDNRLCNLRLVSPTLNAANRRRYLGEDNPACKITKDVAELIRAHPCSLSETAKKFDVSKSLVAQIRRGELWS